MFVALLALSKQEKYMKNVNIDIFGGFSKNVLLSVTIVM